MMIELLVISLSHAPLKLTSDIFVACECIFA